MFVAFLKMRTRRKTAISALSALEVYHTSTNIQSVEKVRTSSSTERKTWMQTGY